MTNKIQIKRIYTPKTVIGELWHNDTLISYTVELPWRDNLRNISCIPEGVYALGKHNSTKFGTCPIVRNVPGRAGILFHAANDADDTDGYSELRGCIAPVTWVRIGNGTVKGMESRRANKIVTNLIFHLLEKDKDNCFLEIIKCV